jgi:hypothetical protein
MSLKLGKVVCEAAVIVTIGTAHIG